MRVTILCPEAHMPDFAPLLACKSPSEAELLRFPAIRWKDAAGQTFRAASFEAGEDAAALWSTPPVLPDWAADAGLDIDAAVIAHARMTVSRAETGIAPPAGDRLTVILGLTGGEVLDLCALHQDLPDDI